MEGLENHRTCLKYANPDYGTIAFSIPRSELNKTVSFIEEELKYNSIYFLIGDDGNTEKIYVGKAGIRLDGQSVVERIKEHNTATNESYYNDWDSVVVFTNEKDSWGATEINALEYIFWRLIPREYRMNNNTPSHNGAALELFTDSVIQIEAYMNVMQYAMFNKTYKNETEQRKITEMGIKEIASNIKDVPVELGIGSIRIPDITTPKSIVKKMVDLLPQELFDDPNITFFDPACKGGEYLVAIRDRILASQNHKSKFENEYIRAVHIASNQLFGVAMTPASLSRATKELGDINIKMIPNYINYIKGYDLGKKNTGEDNTLTDILGREFNRDMRFDVVIGNPPYQENTGSGLNESGGTALFDKFMLAGEELTNRLLCMITPTKWIAGNQMAFKILRRQLLSEKHLVKMVDFFNPLQVFPNIQIAGGVSYFLYDKKYVGDTEFTTIMQTDVAIHDTAMRNMNAETIVPRHAVAESIIKKINLDTGNTEKLMDHVYKDLWKLPTNFEGNIIRAHDTDVEVLTPRGEFYVDKNEVNTSNVNNYKVSFTRAVNGSTFLRDSKKQVLSSLQVIKPGQICNASYMIVGDIGSREEAENIKSYLETKFVRFLVLQTLFGIGLTPDRFQFVPMQNFKEAWTDEKLYSKYNLSADEIVFIEKIMAPLNNNGSAKATVPAIIKNNVAPSAPKLTAQDAMANYINKRVQSEQE